MPSKSMRFTRRGEGNAFHLQGSREMSLESNIFKGCETPLTLLLQNSKKISLSCPIPLLKTSRGMNNHKGYENIIELIPSVPFVFRLKINILI